jgi:hypothetical protein
MQQRTRVKHAASLEDRIAEQANAIKAQAEALPPGSKERAVLERRARHAETFAHMEDWLTSPGLQPPN